MPSSAQTNGLPALIPAYGEIPPTFLEQHGALVSIGVLVFLALAVFLVWKIFQPKPQPVLPPEIVARAALAKLENQPEDGKLLSEVSQILRRYICAAFNLPTNELTTAEFCAAILNHEKIGAELSQTISSFLRECDVRKFSPANSAPSLNAASRAMELVTQVQQKQSTSNEGANP